MSNVEEQEEQVKTTGHRGLKFPMSIPRYDKDLLEIFDLLEKGERSFFARSMIRKGINYCIENGIDIFENTSLSRGNPLLTQQTQQQVSQVTGPISNPITPDTVKDKEEVHSSAVPASNPEEVSASPQIIRAGSPNISRQEEVFDVEDALFNQKK